MSIRPTSLTGKARHCEDKSGRWVFPQGKRVIADKADTDSTKIVTGTLQSVETPIEQSTATNVKNTISDHRLY